MGEKPKNSEPIVHAYDHDAFVGQMLSILARLGRCAGLEAASVDPHHHWKLRARRGFWRPDIQVETIFARSRVAKNHVVKYARLHALRAELCGLANALPAWDGLRLLPSQRADRRCGVWNALEDLDFAIRARKTFYAAGLRA